jgi:hypothetical protein
MTLRETRFIRVMDSLVLRVPPVRWGLLVLLDWMALEVPLVPLVLLVRLVPLVLLVL